MASEETRGVSFVSSIPVVPRGKEGTPRISLCTSHTDCLSPVLIPLAAAGGVITGATKYMYRRALNTHREDLCLILEGEGAMGCPGWCKPCHQHRGVPTTTSFPGVNLTRWHLCTQAQVFSLRHLLYLKLYQIPRYPGTISALINLFYRRADLY